MSHHCEHVVEVQASPVDVFARLDDQTRLAAHMEKPSAMMGGGRMTYGFDADKGQAIGSHIKMGGSAFGISVAVDEVVIERDPPLRKAWKTVAPTRLLIIDAYTMGFDIAGSARGATLKVWIDYTLPSTARWLVSPLAALYARWCVRRMAQDAVEAFQRK